MRMTCITLPQGPSLRSGFYCPGPSTLTWPHPPHLPVQRDFAARRFIRAAFAVRERLGDRRVVPCFRCSFRLDMPPSTTPGSSPAAHAQLLTGDAGLHTTLTVRHSPHPTIRSTWASNFGATSVRSCCGLSTCLPPLADPTGMRSQPTETFTSGLPTR